MDWPVFLQRRSKMKSFPRLSIESKQTMASRHSVNACWFTDNGNENNIPSFTVIRWRQRAFPWQTNVIKRSFVRWVISPHRSNVSTFFILSRCPFRTTLNFFLAAHVLALLMRLRFYLLLQLVFVQFAGRLAIRCYSCAGKIDKKQSNDPCLNPAENVGDGRVSEIECLNSKLCWKGITGGQLKRGCGEKRCAFIPDINMGTFVSQTCCANDLCNRTSSLRSASWMSFFCLIRYLTNKFDWINSRFFSERNNVFLFLSSRLFIHFYSVPTRLMGTWETFFKITFLF